MWLRIRMDGNHSLFKVFECIKSVLTCGRDTYRSDNIVIQNSVINNGDGMFISLESLNSDTD
jgi:hypothetical protein